MICKEYTSTQMQSVWNVGECLTCLMKMRQGNTTTDTIVRSIAMSSGYNPFNEPFPPMCERCYEVPRIPADTKSVAQIGLCGWCVWEESEQT